MPEFNLASVTLTENTLPPRLVLYGVDGIGKSTFAAGAPSPVWVPTVDGIAPAGMPSFPVVTAYPQILDALRALARGGHTYRTVVLDSLDWIERLIHDWTATERGKENIEDIPYGKGYTFAIEHWETILKALDYLNEKGMSVVCIAHAEIKRFDSPETEPYERYQLKLHKHASALVREWADIVGFANREVFIQTSDAGFNKEVRRGVSTGKRVMYTDERPSHVAKNRKSLPEKIDLTWAALRDALAPSYAKVSAPTQPEPEPQTAEVVNG
jgi:hypothetical protein